MKARNNTHTNRILSLACAVVMLCISMLQILAGAVPVHAAGTGGITTCQRGM